MDYSNQRKGASYILALFLACLMVSSSFVGTLDPTNMYTSENSQPMRLEEERVVLSLSDMPGRMAAQLAYDSESDRVIMFGGSIQNLQSDYDDTWSYDYNTNNWTEMSPTIHPPSTEWHQMTYHSGQDRVVLFGGHLAGGGSGWENSDETWTYDYNTNTWTNMAPALAPPGMSGASMVYDSESDLIVLYGGSYGGTDSPPIVETWTYDLTVNTWTNVSPSTQPHARAWSQMAYDSESDDIVLFGGFELEPEPWKLLNDTWTYDANTNIWTEQIVDGPNLLGDLTYDSESDRVVFWGGAVDLDENSYRSETWTYDDNSGTWEQLSPVQTPSGRTRGELTYDSESDRVLLFGGSLNSGFSPDDIMNDLWAYDLNLNLWNNVEWDWNEMTPALSPEPTTYPAMTYDKESDLAVLFGGITDEQYQATGLYGDNETWTYDYNTNTWTNMSPATAPSMRCLSDMVYDEESDIIILYGGLRSNDLDDYPLGDTWAYDVNTDTWTNMSPAVSPGMRYVYSMTYDSKSDRIVLFGGVNLTHNLDDTWMYDYNTNTWTEMSPGASPSPRNAAAIVYDEKEELVVLFGGYVFGYPYEMADTWVYNTTADTWTEMSPTNHPSKRSEMKAVYDSSVDKIIMFGGWAYDVVFDETWSYNYTSNIWIELNTPNAPSSRYWYGIAFDSESDRTILFSGNDGLIGEMNILEADTWAYKYQINPPSGPLNFDVSMSGVNLVLTWDAPVTHPETPITGYNVYIGSSSGTYTLKAQLGNVLTYTDTSVPPGIRQYYVVTAVCSIGEGDYSDEDYGEIPLDVPDDGIYTFIAYGDTRSSDETAVSSLHSTIVSKFLQGDPEFVIHTGDMVNHGGEAYQWPLFEESISLIRDADPPIPFYGAVGNHEWYTDIYDVNDEDYSNYLAWADYSDVVDGDETELYYSFDRENIHFIVLNTVETWVGDDYTCPTAQWDWLVSDFEANQYEFIIVSFHNPMYSVRADRPDRWAQAESLRDTFQSLFEANGVDIVFNGHDHHYYRTVRNGIQYIVTGGGGAPLYDLQYIDTVWQAGDRGFKAYHFLNCSILPYNETHDQLSVGVVLMNGDVQDSFELLIPLPPIIPTTPTTPTGYTDPPPFDWVMTVVIVGGVAVVLVVLVLIVRKRS